MTGGRPIYFLETPFLKATGSIEVAKWEHWHIQDPERGTAPYFCPYFVGIFPYIDLIYGRYLQFRFVKWSLK